MENYYTHIHLDTNIKTVKSFIESGNSIAKFFIRKDREFLLYEGEKGISNLDLIWCNYTDEQKSTFSSEWVNLSEEDKKTYRPSYKDVNYDLPYHTILRIPSDKSNNELLAIQGKDVYQENQLFSAFLSEEIWRIILDPTYIKSDDVLFDNNKSSVKYLHTQTQVWIYMKAINKILNITPFISKVDINVSEGGGTFSMSLSCIEDIDSSIKDSNFYINYFQLVSNQNINTPYFHKFIQQNDVVWIRFEKLDIEKEKRSQLQYELEISSCDIPGNIYDMIGLVDKNSFNSDAISQGSVNISGRDLSKLLVEDGNYFFPFALMGDSNKFFLNEQSDKRFLKRLFMDGSYNNIYFAYAFKTIRDSLGFIFNQLSNVGVIGDELDLFEGYSYSSEPVFSSNNTPTDRRSKVYEVSNADKNYLKSVEKNGIWQIIKLVVDSQLDDRRIVSSDITKPDGSLMDYINKVCQDPLVEFWGDTYGDQFTFIARQPVTTESQLRDILINRENSIIDIETGSVSNYTLDWEDKYFSWFQIKGQDSFLGGGNYISAAYIPIVYLPEYVQYFGLHKKVLNDSYISFNALKGVGSVVGENLFRSALTRDFRYIIESNSVLPFTRKGSITIKGGDRRIKKGGFVRFKGTREIFYVDSVSNSLSVTGSTIERETIVQVSRGMIEDYILREQEGVVGISFSENLDSGKKINPVEHNRSKPTYFDIVNSYDIFSTITYIGQQEFQQMSTLGVVEDPVFKFFIKRLQFLSLEDGQREFNKLKKK